MAAITMISSAFALLLLISQVAFAQQWTPGGRRKHVGELLPTQSCFVTEVSHSFTFISYWEKIFSRGKFILFELQ